MPVASSSSSSTAVLFPTLVNVSSSPGCFDPLGALLEDDLLLVDISPDQKSKHRQVGILVFSVKLHRIL
jgi:hypothetical protein